MADTGRPRNTIRKLGNRNGRAQLSIPIGDEGFSPDDNVKVEIEKVKNGKAIYTVTKTKAKAA